MKINGFWRPTGIHGLYFEIIKGDYSSNEFFDKVRPVLQSHAKAENIGNFGRFVSTAEREELDIFAEQLVEQARLAHFLGHSMRRALAKPAPVPYIVTLWDNQAGMGIEIRATGRDTFFHEFAYPMSVTYNGAPPPGRLAQSSWRWSSDVCRKPSATRMSSSAH